MQSDAQSMDINPSFHTSASATFTNSRGQISYILDIVKSGVHKRLNLTENTVEDINDAFYQYRANTDYPYIHTLLWNRITPQEIPKVPLPTSQRIHSAELLFAFNADISLAEIMKIYPTVIDKNPFPTFDYTPHRDMLHLRTTPNQKHTGIPISIALRYFYQTDIPILILSGSAPGSSLSTLLENTDGCSPTVKQGTRNFTYTYFKNHTNHGSEPDRIREILNLFQKRHPKGLVCLLNINNIPDFPDIEDTLVNLQENGYGIITSGAYSSAVFEEGIQFQVKSVDIDNPLFFKPKTGLPIQVEVKNKQANTTHYANVYPWEHMLESAQYPAGTTATILDFI